MRKFICSVMFFGWFAFIYLVGFSTQVQAGAAPGPVDCSTIVCGINCPGAGADCFGTDGNDFICGSATGESIFAGKGADQVCAGGGNDVIHGGFGDDQINGEGDDDTIQGGWGDDNLAGGAGDDTILDGRCDDTTDGGSGSEVAGDTCLGGLGDDAHTTCENDDLGQETADNHQNCAL